MVEATAENDGVNRTVGYAHWRNDVDPSEGYSKELISDAAPKDTNWDEPVI